MNRTFTAISAAAWVAACGYLYFAWPSLVALLEAIASPGAEPLVRLPRLAFPALGLLAVSGLLWKDRCLRSRTALAVDAVVGAPAFAVLALLLQPFLVPVE
jgi:hypothetical protein